MALRRPRAHRATTRHLAALYPFMGERGLGGRGVLIGHEVYSGAAFAYDPFALYAQGLITGPSAIVAGQVGRGKSALIMCYLARLAALGRRAVVVDPKGEYDPLCRWFGSRAIRLEPGGTVRLNPLEAGADRGRRLALLAAILAAGLGRALGPEEHAALDLALGEGATAPATLPEVQARLLAPEAGAAAAVAASAESLARDGRALALELRRLCAGDLRGMFDGPTSPGVNLEAPVVVLDLSALHGSPALGILMTCVAAWLEARLERDDGVRRIVVLDEGWAVLSDVATAAFVQRSWKLARSYGVQNVLVVHRLSDLAAAGGAGSRQVRIAEGLLADSETRVILGQGPADLAQVRQLVGLTHTEAEHVAQLPRGVALWKVGGRSFLVENRLSGPERALVDTDQRMRPAATRGSAPEPHEPLDSLDPDGGVL